MRLGIVTCIWRRPKLTELVMRYYSGLQIPGVEIVASAVYSAEDDTADWLWDALPWFSIAASRTGVIWTLTSASNEPLGAKWNVGLAALRGVDAVLIIGSDDLVSASYIERVSELIAKGIDYITIRNIYIFDALRQRLAYAHSVMPGAGRVVSRRVLDAVDWKLWDDNANNMLDSSLGSRLSRVPGLEMRNHHLREMLATADGPTSERTYSLSEYAVVDIKTDVNMWALEGDRLVGPHEQKLRKVTELEARPFFEAFFPEQAEALLAWNQ